MQHSSLLPSTLRAGAFACAALLASAAPAAELGDVTVRSFIGQQLAADIELIALTPDEVNNLPVRLASADVYRGAGLTVDPALAGLRLSVVQREQRWFLHMTTLKPIDANHLYLYLELGSGEHQVVREATVWLAADPHPAPPPAIVAVPEAPPVVVPAAVIKQAAKPDARLAAKPETRPDARLETKPEAKPEAKPDAALIAAIARAHPQGEKPRAAAPAETPAAAHEAAVAKSAASGEAAAARPATPKEAGNVKPASKEMAAIKPAPPKDAVGAKPAASSETASARPAMSKDAAAVHEAAANAAASASSETAAGKSHAQHDASALHDPALGAKPAGATAAAPAPASCPVKPLRIGSKECVALDYHNAALASKIDELEDKVRVLQTALEGPKPKPAPAASAIKAPSASAGHASLPKLKYRDKKLKEKAEDHGSKAWMWIAGGAAVLTAAGGVFYWLRKRKAKQGGSPLKIWQGWRKKKAVEEVKQEPVAPATPEEIATPQE